MEVQKDGRTWRTGTQADVSWMAGLPFGSTIATAIPLVFEAYARLEWLDHEAEAEHERAVMDVLRQHTAEQPWWLGFLETGAHDIVFPEAPRVTLYADWPYVLVEAGPEQARAWRSGTMGGGVNGSLPDLMFPADRSWLVSALWDDDWCSIGGPEQLVAALVSEPLAGARRVQP